MICLNISVLVLKLFETERGQASEFLDVFRSCNLEETKTKILSFYSIFYSGTFKGEMTDFITSRFHERYIFLACILTMK